MPTARAIHKLSEPQAGLRRGRQTPQGDSEVGDSLLQVKAKSEGEREATGAPLRRVICRDAVKLALNETAPRRRGEQPAEATKASKRGYI